MTYYSYRIMLNRWLELCDIRDEHGDPVHLTPHQWRHTFASRLINRDVPQEVIRRPARPRVDRDDRALRPDHRPNRPPAMGTGHQGQRQGERVVIDPDGPLAQAQWAKTRYGIATQTLPHGYCGLPVQKSCPHANACLTCPVFLTGPEFLPELREHRGRTLTLIQTAETAGHGTGRADEPAGPDQPRPNDQRHPDTTMQQPISTGQPMRADNSQHLVAAARKRADPDPAQGDHRAPPDRRQRLRAITFDSVAREAGVSRSWLYAQPDLRAQIEQLRARNHQRPATAAPPERQRATDASLLRRLEAASRPDPPTRAGQPATARRARPSTRRAPQATITGHRAPGRDTPNNPPGTNLKPC